MGYFMAQAKFEHKPIWWIPLGVSIAAVLNGTFTWIIDEVSAAGLTVEPWRSLVAGIIIAIGVFLVLVALMRRAHQLDELPASGSRRNSMIQTSSGTVYGQRFLRKDIGVAIVVGVALAIGLLLRSQVTTRTTMFQAKGAPITL